MPIEIKMPALSPTMEEGTLAKWLVKEGQTVKSGDLLAEIETDKATMEFEAVDEGTIAKLVVSEGTDGVKVGAVIALLSGEGEAQTPEPAAPEAEAHPSPADPNKQGNEGAPATRTVADAEDHGRPADAGPATPVPAAAPAAMAEPDDGAARVIASPLARRIAAEKGVDLAQLKGSGPNGRIVKADVDGGDARPPSAATPAAGAPASAVPPAKTKLPVRKVDVTLPGADGRVRAAGGSPSSSGGAEASTSASAAVARAPTAATAPKPVPIPDIPYEAAKLSNIRKTIARRLTEAKQTIPHIYLTVDIRLDPLLRLRGELNSALAKRDVKLSVNDLLIKALALSLIDVPTCNVMFTPDQLISFTRADISVAVSTPSGLITPIIVDAAGKGLAAISAEMKDLAARARDNKLKPEEYMGGTASISNMGMYGIKQFEAVINPPQGMIMAIGAGEKRPYIVDDAPGVATIMSATGSFDHRAIDGADGARLMQAFKTIVEAPLALVA